MYFSQETKQNWSANDPKQQEDPQADAIDGGALWLPGNVVLELQMLPMVCANAAAEPWHCSNNTMYCSKAHQH